MITHKKYKIKGVFGKKEINVDIRFNTRSEVLYVLLHGAYGKVYSTEPTKYEKLAVSLSKKYNVGFYQTSRRFMHKDRPDLDYDQYREQSFGGKKFKDEWEDVQRGVKELRRYYKQEKGRLPKEVICVGFSLGGIWASFLSNNKLVSKIFTFGSAVKFLSPNSNPLFETFPSKAFIADKLAKYKGEFHVVRGSFDELTTTTNSYNLFQAAQAANIRSFSEWHAVDHQFSTINGIKSENLLIERILRMIVRI